MSMLDDLRVKEYWSRAVSITYKWAHTGRPRRNSGASPSYLFLKRDKQPACTLQDDADIDNAKGIRIGCDRPVR